MSMLKEIVISNNEEPYPQIDIPIEISMPKKLQIKHCNEYKEDINDMFQRMNNSVTGYD